MFVTNFWEDLLNYLWVIGNTVVMLILASIVTARVLFGAGFLNDGYRGPVHKYRRRACAATVALTGARFALRLFG